MNENATSATFSMNPSVWPAHFRAQVERWSLTSSPYLGTIPGSPVKHTHECEYGVSMETRTPSCTYHRTRGAAAADVEHPTTSFSASGAHERRKWWDGLAMPFTATTPSRREPVHASRDVPVREQATIPWLCAPRGPPLNLGSAPGCRRARRALFGARSQHAHCGCGLLVPDGEASRRENP